MQPFACDLDPDYMQRIAQRARASLAHLPRAAANLGTHLLAKLSPPQWTLEWYLPKWLGSSYALAPEVIQDLVEANLYGMLFICLQDKIADEGLSTEDAVPITCLTTALHQSWIEQYIPLFATQPQFWHSFDEYLMQWLEATAVSNSFPATTFGQMLQADFLRLAHRAAPLKVCCAATATLAGREDLLPRLVQALDHLHVAAVLLDHVLDWREDLAAGRYNTFVHFASNAPQTPANQIANTERVYEELLLGGTGRDYFALAMTHARIAGEIAATTACPSLAEYMHWYQTMLMDCSDDLAASAHHYLNSARLELFGE